MLSSFRSAIKGVVAWFIIALLIVSFALFGVPELRNFSQPGAIQIGKTRIGATQIRQALELEITNHRSRTGDALTLDEAVAAGLGEKAIQTIIARAMTQLSADVLELRAPASTITDYLNENAGLTDPITGKIDRRRLETILRNNNISFDAFLEMVETDIISQHLFSALSASQPAPKILLTSLLARQGETRDVQLLHITPAIAGKPAKPGNEELRAFYDTHQSNFIAPEYRSFSAVILRNADFTVGQSVDEDVLRELFSQHKKTLDTPEKRNVIQMPFTNQEEAQDAYARLKTGDSFADVATAYGKDLARLTYIEVTQSDILDADVGRALFAASKEEIIGPIESLFGFTIGQVVDIFPGTVVSFESQRAALEAEALHKIAHRHMLEVIEQIELARDEGASLEDAVSDVDNATVTSFGPVDRVFFTPGGAILDDLPTAILTQAFMLEEGDESGVLELDNAEGYFFLALENVIPAALRSFDDVQDRVTTQWHRQNQNDILTSYTNTLQQRLLNGETMDDVANDIGLDVERTTISRQSPPTPDLPRTIIDKIMSANLQTPLIEPLAEDARAIIAWVHDAHITTFPQADALLPLYQENLGAQIGNELTNAYFAMLQSEMDIQRNSAQLAIAFGTSE